MLIDLLSMSNYVSYNIKVAQVLGLNAAIYISELMNINDKALHKNKVKGEYFTLDRAYLKNRTTFDEDLQLSIEDQLIKLGIMSKENESKNEVSLNITALTSIIMSPDESLIKDIQKIVRAKSSTKRTKADAIKEGLKENITTTNEELREAYSDWIDSVFAKEGWMSKKAVVAAQGVVDEFSQFDLDIALKVVEIAAINGYRDMSWAVNTYKKDYMIQYRMKPVQPVKPSQLQLSDEKF